MGLVPSFLLGEYYEKENRKMVVHTIRQSKDCLLFYRKGSQLRLDIKPVEIFYIYMHAKYII